MIGWSALEAGDPAMGVALGRLHVTPAYDSARSGALLRVRPEGEPFFEPSGGVYIEDHRDELGADEIEVSVLGIDATTYARYFPHHIRAYEQHFRRR